MDKSEQTCNNESTTHLKEGKLMDKDQEIERLERQVEHKDGRISGLQRHIESLDRQIAQLIEADTQKDDFILKIRKELIARL